MQRFRTTNEIHTTLLLPVTAVAKLTVISWSLVLVEYANIDPAALIALHATWDFACQQGGWVLRLQFRTDQKVKCGQTEKEDTACPQDPSWQVRAAETHWRRFVIEDAVPLHPHASAFTGFGVSGFHLKGMAEVWVESGTQYQ